jgi:hypothetical protein
MLSEATSALLNTLTYRADARVRCSLMPLGGIFWEDELPDHNQFLSKIPDDDQRHIMRLFGIRVRLWDGQTLRHEDQQFWDAMQSLVPRWAFFERLSVSADELCRQDEIAKQAEEVYEALFAEADKVEISEQDGVKNFRVTFDLYKNHDAVPENKSLWQRILRRVRSAEN